MEDQIDQLPAKYNRPKLRSSYKDQFLQEISSYVHETDHLISNTTTEVNTSNRKTKESIISPENIPPESDDVYHKRSQIPKRPKAQTTSQKKSLIPTPTRASKKNSRKIETKNATNSSKENTSIVPLTEDDLTHFFDFAAGSISNDESSAQQSPEKIKTEINQKKRSKSPGPRLNTNNRNSISEKHPAKRSKSPSVVRKKTRKSVKNSNSPRESNSKNQDEHLLTPTMNDNYDYNYAMYEDEFENVEYFKTPQRDKTQKKISNSPNKNKSPSSDKKISTESEGCSPKKIINPPPPHHQDLLDDINERIKQKKTDRISKSETPEINLYSIEGKQKKRQTGKSRKKNSLTKYTKYSKNLDDYDDNSDENEENYDNEFENKILTDFDIQQMKSGWTAPNVQSFQSSSPNQSSSSINLNSISSKDNTNKQNKLLDDEKKLNSKSLSSESPNTKNAFENLKSSDSESEIEQDLNPISFPKEINNELIQNNNLNLENIESTTINYNSKIKPNNDFDLISFSPMKSQKVEDLILFSEHSAIKDEIPKNKRLPYSPLSPNDKNDKPENIEKSNDKYFPPNHIFLVNANSDKSEEEDYSPKKLNNDIKSQSINEINDNDEYNYANSKTNSDLMGFTEIEIKTNIPTSPPHKVEIVPIEPIDTIVLNENSTEKQTTPQKVITDSLIAEFLDFGNNTPKKMTNNNNESTNKEENQISFQNTSEIEHSNLINLTIENQTEITDENNDSNKNDKKILTNEPGNNDFENSEVVLSSSSLLSPARPPQVKDDIQIKADNSDIHQNDNSYASAENSNFISFSTVENPIPQKLKQASLASTPKIEILQIPDSTISAISPENMNLSIFNSPLKPGESHDTNKYKLDSSDIFNFSKHSIKSEKQNQNEKENINSNNNDNNLSSTSSPSFSQNNYNDQPTNKTMPKELSENSEKADSELADSPERGVYSVLFKSPIKMNYLNAKKTYGTTLFSMELSPNNDDNSLSISKTKNINGSMSSSPISESASESVAVSTSALSSSSPNKRARRQPKKAISILDQHFISIEETSSQFASSSTLDPIKSQQKEMKSPENDLNAKSNVQSEKNNEADFISEFNKFVKGDKNALLKTYENSEINSTFNDESTEANTNNENQNDDLSISQNNDFNTAEIAVEEEEEDIQEDFNKNNDDKNCETNEFNENENQINQEYNNINEGEDYVIPNDKNIDEDINNDQKYQYSIELDSIPTLPSLSNRDEIGINGEIKSTKAKRLTNEETKAIQKKVFCKFASEEETETENYIGYEKKEDNDLENSKNYRKKKPTSDFMISQNDYSYSEINSENKFSKANNDLNQNFEGEEKTAEKENEDSFNDENEIDNDDDNEKNEQQIINSELAEAIAEHNFTPQVIHDLVHSITGVPKKISKNLNTSGNLNNTSFIKNEDTIFEFQERFVSIIEVEILTNEGEIVNIFPTNLNDYLKDRNSFINDENKEKEKEAKPKSNIAKLSKKQIKTDNSKKNQLESNNKSPKEITKSPARNKSPTKSSFIKSPSNYNSPYKGPSPKKKINDKSPSKLSNNKQSPSQLTKSPKSLDSLGPKKENSKKQREIVDPFSTVKLNQKPQKKGNQKEKLNSRKTSFDSENEFENEENEKNNDIVFENDNQGLINDSTDEFISVSTPTKSPKSSRSSTPIKERSNKKSPSSQRNSNINDDFENSVEDDQNDDFVNVSTPKKKQSKALNSNTNSPYSKKQTNSNKKNTNLSKNLNKQTPNSSNSKLNKPTRQNQFSHSNNDEPSDLDDFTPVQTHKVTKKANNLPAGNNTPSPSPFVSNSLTKPKRIESDSGDSFLNVSNNNNSEVNSSSILIENNNNNNIDPDEFVSVSANATPQKVDLEFNTNSNLSKTKNSANAKSPSKETATNSNKKKQPLRKGVSKKQSTITTNSSSDEFITSQDNQNTNQQQKQKGGNQTNSNNVAAKKKPNSTNATRMKPSLLGHPNSNNNNNNNQPASSGSKKDSIEINHQNPFAKGKNKELQFALRKPLKKVSTVNKKQTQANEKDEVFDEVDDLNNNEIFEDNRTNFEQDDFDDEEPQQQELTKQQTSKQKKLFSKQPKPKQNEVSPSSQQQQKSPKIGSNKKKTQLLSPKTIEDPFKAVKATKQQTQTNSTNSGSGRKKKNSFQPITKSNNNNNNSNQTAASKLKKGQTSLSTGNPPNKKNMNDINEASSSSSFQMPFNIDTTLFSDANFQKKQLMPQASPNKKPKTLASVLISADDDYSEDD